MTDKIFREGGPLNIKRTGPDKYNMSVSIPPDSSGRFARECPSETCSPGYFKVKSGTGITSHQEIAYCPYCRFGAKPTDFATKEQLRYAKDLVRKEAKEGIERMLKQSLGIGSSGKKTMGGGLFSIEMSYKPGPKSHVRRPIDEEVRRDIICPNCGLDHSVYGLATWCADCGSDIFLTHIATELDVVRMMLSDVDRRRENLGVRIAAKDLENCLEDVVSIFEASLRAFVRRLFFIRNTSVENIEQFMKKIGNAFQNVRRAEQIFKDEFQISLFSSLDEKQLEHLIDIFEKRHPISHNLGVVDKKYIEPSEPPS